MLSGENPLVCLDNRFCCVSSSDGKFRTGECLLQYIADVVPEPLGRVMDTAMHKDGHLFCCRIYPIKNDVGESVAYIGELFNSQAAGRISEKTENRLELLRLCNAIEANTAAVWECTRVLRSKSNAAEYPCEAQLTAIENAAADISTVCRNAFEYANMLGKNHDPAVIDAGEHCSSLERRCNAALAKCGRRIELLTEPEDLRIYADSHCAVRCLGECHSERIAVFSGGQ